MLPVKILGPNDYRDMPWKNGGGTTCEIFRLPHPTRADAFAVRVSIASVASGGPFSRFDGIHRTLMLLEGDGMVLGMNGTSNTLSQVLVPIEFEGETAVDCRLLGGPLRDFNVMVARDWGMTQTDVLMLENGQTHACDGAPCVLAYVHRGALEVGGVDVLAGHLLWAPHGEAFSLMAKGQSQIVLVRATPV